MPSINKLLITTTGDFFNTIYIDNNWGFFVPDNCAMYAIDLLSINDSHLYINNEPKREKVS